MAESYGNGASGYGLITNMANGIREGLIGYQTLANQKHQNQMQELMSGVTKDEDGNLQLTPQAQQARDFAAQKQKDEMDQYKQSHDVNSQYSQNVRTQHGLLAKTFGVGDENSYNGLNAAQVEEQDKGILGPLSSYAGAKAKAGATVDAAQTRADLAKQIADQKTTQGSGKDAEKADKAYTEMRKNMETFRGNTGAQQASVALQNADKALAIVKNKDPNSLTTQDLTLFADEMGKIASGGVPGEHGVQALMPNNAQTQYAKLVNFLSSKPTDAQAGEYIKHNMSYLNDMRDVAAGTLSKYRENIAKGYKHRVAPEDYDEASQDYGFGKYAPAPQAQAQAAAPTRGLVTGGQGQQAAPIQGKPAPNGAVTIKQGMHTFTWNPQTGKYE